MFETSFIEGIWNLTIQNLDFLKIKIQMIRFSKGRAILSATVMVQTIQKQDYSGDLKSGRVQISNGGEWVG